ncbi:MAG: hypothetical protein Q7U97_17895 [Rhodocyclaceae bacterium]|nr:hypothetical protein [Rhodocyclaceae bacterium]
MSGQSKIHFFRIPVLKCTCSRYHDDLASRLQPAVVAVAVPQVRIGKVCCVHESRIPRTGTDHSAVTQGYQHCLTLSLFHLDLYLQLAAVAAVEAPPRVAAEVEGQQRVAVAAAALPLAVVVGLQLAAEQVSRLSAKLLRDDASTRIDSTCARHMYFIRRTLYCQPVSPCLLTDATTHADHDDMPDLQPRPSVPATCGST